MTEEERMAACQVELAQLAKRTAEDLGFGPGRKRGGVIILLVNEDDDETTGAFAGTGGLLDAIFNRTRGMLQELAQEVVGQMRRFPWAGATSCLLLLALLAACAAPRAGTPLPAPPHVTSETRFVSCMDSPPPIEVIDWPTPDRVGNVLLHESTVERVKNAYADLRRYALENYFRCLHVAEARGEQSVTVEVDP